MSHCKTCKWWLEGWKIDKPGWKFCQKYPTEPYCLNNYTCFDDFCDEWKPCGDKEVMEISANGSNGE